MALYKKRPVEVEAMQMDVNNLLCVTAWINSIQPDQAEANIDEAGNPTIAITTLEGVMTANDGDYIIQGIQGEFYPCKPDIFEQTYVRVA